MKYKQTNSLDIEFIRKITYPNNFVNNHLLFIISAILDDHVGVNFNEYV
jgi:hypothetical protein